jgi:dUTP pyrophosphatase
MWRMKMSSLYNIYREIMGNASHIVPNELALCDAVEQYLNQPQELKVLRTEAAKKYPLISFKKDGDVGLDLPSLLDGPIVVRPVDPGLIMTRTYNYHGDWLVDSNVRGIANRVQIPTGIRVELPHGYWASIEARSSTSNMGLICPDAVIDNGYRGEVFVVLLNIGDQEIVVNPGDRMAQLIVHKRHPIKVIEVDELNESERGETGFGSTGR